MAATHHQPPDEISAVLAILLAVKGKLGSIIFSCSDGSCRADQSFLKIKAL